MLNLWSAESCRVMSLDLPESSRTWLGPRGSTRFSLLLSHNPYSASPASLEACFKNVMARVAELAVRSEQTEEQLRLQLVERPLCTVDMSSLKDAALN